MDQKTRIVPPPSHVKLSWAPHGWEDTYWVPLRPLRKMEIQNILFSFNFLTRTHALINIHVIPKRIDMGAHGLEDTTTRNVPTRRYVKDAPTLDQASPSLPKKRIAYSRGQAFLLTPPHQIGTWVNITKHSRLAE